MAGQGNIFMRKESAYHLEIHDVNIFSIMIYMHVRRVTVKPGLWTGLDWTETTITYDELHCTQNTQYQV